MEETQRYSPDPTLSPIQHQVLSLLAEGASTTAAAAAAGVHRNTVLTWRRTHPAFARELDFAARERSLFWHDQAAALAAQALAVLNEILNDKSASPALRLRAALKVISMASDPQPKPMRPFPTAAMEAEANLGRTLLLNQNAAEKLEKVHNSAQSPNAAAENTAQNCTNQPVRRSPEPSRNAPCPCKSGLKFKRCCSGKTTFPTPATHPAAENTVPASPAVHVQ